MSNLRSTITRASLAAACALALAACGDRDAPLSPQDPATPAPLPSLVASVQCNASVRSGTISCGQAALPDGVRGYIIVGGQHQHVDITSGNVAYDGVGAFTFDVTVKNLIPQAMGTVDGVTADTNGVRVIFATGPTVTGGQGDASVANADGSDTFTGTGQPFFRYAGAALGADGMLSTNETTSVKNWNLHIDPTVDSFSFTLYVVTEVAKPNGWVDVYPGINNLLTGDSVVLSDTVRTAVGTPLTDPVTWASSDTTVARVTAGGVVTAIAPGSVVITATSGIRSGTLSLGVCPNLAVGAAYTASMPAASSLCLSGGASGAEYVYMPSNLSQGSALSSFGVTATNIVTAVGPPTNNRIPLPAGFNALRVPEDGGLQPGSDLPFLEKDLPHLNDLLKNPKSRVHRGSRGGARAIITQNAVPAIGDLMDLNTNTSCSGTPSVRTGQVRTVSNHLIIVSDTANPAGGFTTAQYDSIALEFDTIAWKADSANFGMPTDVDGNGHVVAFFTRAVNELTPPASSSYVLGFFASKDVFSNDPVNGCTNSNMGEMFYMLVPDPTGVVNSNVRTVSLVRGNTTGTLGHEFQHMINGFRRAYVTGASFFEQGFLNEGLSHIAEELMFYRASGMSPRINIRLGTDATSGIQLNSKRVAAFNAYANPNFGRFKGWISRPDTTGAFKQNPNSLAVRGAIWAYLRYAADRINGNDQTFWYNLVNSNLEGTTNIQNAIGGASPTAWLRDFMAAMYADDNSFTVASQYMNPSWNFRNMYSALGGWSLQLRPMTSNTAVTVTYGSGGTAQYMRFGVAASNFARVTTSSSPLTPYAMVVMRTK